MRQRYGWCGQVEAKARHDERDLLFAASPHVLEALPASCDLESLWQGRDVFDQGPLGSCGPNSAGGHPFIFRFKCYESLEWPAVKQTGMIPLPGRGERTIGGHDVVFCGYDDSVIVLPGSGSPGAFKLRNSWGKRWGQSGYGWIPYD